MGSAGKANIWAESLLSDPVKLSDDYGNLIHSLGVSQQQRSDEARQVLPKDTAFKQTPAEASPAHGNRAHDVHQSSNPAKKTNRGRTAGSSRSACSTCHVRKVKCDISQSRNPCSNCRKMSLECKLHERRRRPANIESTESGTSSWTGSAVTTVRAIKDATERSSSLALSGAVTVYDSSPT